MCAGPENKINISPALSTLAAMQRGIDDDVSCVRGRFNHGGVMLPRPAEASTVLAPGTQIVSGPLSKRRAGVHCPKLNSRILYSFVFRKNSRTVLRKSEVAQTEVNVVRSDHALAESSFKGTRALLN